MVTPTTANGAFVQGCFALVQSHIEHHVTVLGGVSIAVIVIMVSTYFLISCIYSYLKVLNLFLSFYLCTCGLSTDQEARPKKKFYGRPGQGGGV
jgi:hypothetical protein